jgi:hypothetical protein
MFAKIVRSMFARISVGLGMSILTFGAGVQEIIVSR